MLAGCPASHTWLCSSLVHTYTVFRYPNYALTWWSGTVSIIFSDSAAPANLSTTGRYYSALKLLLLPPLLFSVIAVVAALPQRHYKHHTQFALQSITTIKLCIRHHHGSNCTVRRLKNESNGNRGWLFFRLYIHMYLHGIGKRRLNTMRPRRRRRTVSHNLFFYILRARA